MAKQKDKAEINDKSARRLFGRSGDLTLKDGTTFRMAKVAEVKTRVTMLRLETPKGEVTIPISAIAEFKEYGTEWTGPGKAQPDEEENKPETAPE